MANTTGLKLSELFETQERAPETSDSSLFINRTRTEMLRLSSLSAEKRYIETHCPEEMRAILKSTGKESLTEIEFKSFLANLIRKVAKTV